MLKLYTDISYLSPENRRFVFPLLFDLWYVPNANLLEKYQIVTAIEDCDIIVVPIDIAHYDVSKKQQKLNQFINQALGLGKKVWSYSAGDFGQSLNGESYTFRLGGLDSKLNQKTFILPSFINDPYDFLEKDFVPIPKSAMPKIGFVGHASGSVVKWVKEYLLFLRYNCRRLMRQIKTDYQPFYPSVLKRFKYLNVLEQHRPITTHFIFRDKYRAGIKTDKEKNETTIEFFNNMESNPYTFCMRGTGNFSVRLYETLAMGPIPVVVDTNFRLPLNNLINWKNHCVLVKEDKIVESLIDFHQKISVDQFEVMQRNNRKLWLNHLKRDAYFLNIYNFFKEES